MDEEASTPSEQGSRSSSPMSMHAAGPASVTSVQPADSKLCMYSAKPCKQRRVAKYDYCVRHILEDPTAPYRQCIYMRKIGAKEKQCLGAVSMKTDETLCGLHRTMMDRKLAELEEPLPNAPVPAPAPAVAAASSSLDYEPPPIDNLSLLADVLIREHALHPLIPPTQASPAVQPQVLHNNPSVATSQHEQQQIAPDQFPMQIQSQFDISPPSTSMGQAMPPQSRVPYPSGYAAYPPPQGYYYSSAPPPMPARGLPVALHQQQPQVRYQTVPPPTFEQQSPQPRVPQFPGTPVTISVPTTLAAQVSTPLMTPSSQSPALRPQVPLSATAAPTTKFIRLKPKRRKYPADSKAALEMDIFSLGFEPSSSESDSDLDNYDMMLEPSTPARAALVLERARLRQKYLLEKFADIKQGRPRWHKAKGSCGRETNLDKSQVRCMSEIGGKMCCARALPWSNFCPRHIGQSLDQVLFQYCSHSGCSKLIFDPFASGPYCWQHRNLKELLEPPNEDDDTAVNKKFAGKKKKRRTSARLMKSR